MDRGDGIGGGGSVGPVASVDGTTTPFSTVPVDLANPPAAVDGWRWEDALFDAPELRRFADQSLEEIAATAGLRSIDVVAWRDFDDMEAGGSELHAHRIMSAWAAAGININMTTSTAPGAPPFIRRSGYRVTRRVGRYSIFPRTMISGVLGRLGRGDGLVEIWNGMPFLSPLWAQCPRIVFLHHVHAEMWKMVLPQGLAEIGLQRGAHHGPAGLPPEPHRHAVAVLQRGDRESAWDPRRQRVGMPTRRRGPVRSRARFVRRSPSSWRSDGWSRSSGSSC